MSVITQTCGFLASSLIIQQPNSSKNSGGKFKSTQPGPLTASPLISALANPKASIVLSPTRYSVLVI